jgi:hypothetical protein
MSKQDKITKAARGRDCQVRLPGCPNNTETTVLAHYRLAGTCGVGIKPNNLQGAWADDYCHSICDGRLPPPESLSRDEIRLYHAEGCFRTMDTLVREGVIK